MNDSLPLPSIEALKSQAVRLRTDLNAMGESIGHSRALELLAHQYGYRDWNTLHAAVGNRPPPCPVNVGQMVAGLYLGQPFEAEVIGVRSFDATDRFRATFDFEEPVDVVTFDSFSAFRKRVSCTIDRNGKTLEKTSNGKPQLELRLR